MSDKPTRTQLLRKIERLETENALLRERVNTDARFYAGMARELAELRIMQQQMQKVIAGELIE